MSSVEVGRAAEDAAAGWLTHIGFTILDRNWRTRWCELDIICRRNATIHFVEVKYRRSSASGSGFEAITPAKAQRLRRAALMWLTKYRHYGDSQIDVIAVWGFPKPRFLDYRPNAVAGE